MCGVLGFLTVFGQFLRFLDDFWGFLMVFEQFLVFFDGFWTVSGVFKLDSCVGCLIFRCHVDFPQIAQNGEFPNLHYFSVGVFGWFLSKFIKIGYSGKTLFLVYFGSILAIFGLFWINFGCFWSILGQFWLFLVNFRSILAVFGLF